MVVTMVKKRLADGRDCEKCAQAEQLLRGRGVWERIDRVVWALFNDATSEGQQLAERHGVSTAPFFVVRAADGTESVVTSVLAMARQLQQGEKPTQPSPAEKPLAFGPDDLAGLDPHDAKGMVARALGAYGELCPIAFSGAEDVVLIDLAARSELPFAVFCLDTGRLHPETYRFIERVREHYGVDIELLSPDPVPLERLVRTKGLFSFLRDGHGECCGIRKLGPLRRALARQRGWITGQRKDQSPSTRSEVPLVEIDQAFSGLDAAELVKVNPLSNWTSQQVWSYIREHDVPYNPLHERGFVSIGCEPCTRPTLPGQHEREGRWWWEEATQKECGLHVTPSATKG